MCEKNVTHDKKTNKKTNKITNKKTLFLTYIGLLRVLFTTKNNKTDKFVHWASQILFAAQMGTDEQKQKSAAKVLGTTYDVVKAVFNKTAYVLPVIYLLKIGLAKDVKKHIEFDNIITKSAYVYKFGFTIDFKRRMSEHNTFYSNLLDESPELVYYQYIDPQYLSDAELDLKSFFKNFDFSINNPNHTELVVITNTKLKDIKKQYELIGTSYKGHISEMMCKLKEYENTINQLNQENIMLKDKIENNKILHNEQLKNANMKIELLETKYELEKLRSKKH
jgi:hypothetical protein